MTEPAALADAIREEVGTVLVGYDDHVERLTVALLTRGHVLIEGVPGVAKTTLATVFARATGLSHNRIQLTPDVLPADVTGTTVYREDPGTFAIQRGPVFANLVVADEINRATPKTQSAFLEAMEEASVTIEGETLDLPRPFMVVATQNPIEMEGTFDLPEAQRDRFQLKLTVDLPGKNRERRLLDRFDGSPTLGPDDVDAVVSTEEILAARGAVADVYVDERIRDYVVDLVDATRSHPDVVHGASPRASLAYLQSVKAWAAIRGRDYVIPDDVKRMARPTLNHRLVLTTDAELGDVGATAVVEDVLESVVPPGGDAEAEREEAAVQAE